MTTPPRDVNGSEVLRTLVREHRDGLVSYAERMLNDHGLAEDVVQETLVRAWRNIDRLTGMDGSLRSWLFTVTRHLVIDWIRKPQVRKETVGATYVDPVAARDEMDAVLTAMVVRPLLQQLSPEHRAVLVHIYLCDHTIQETAGILGVPPGTVKSRQHNALRKLRHVAMTEAA